MPDEPPDKARRTILYSGTVQGVGFRYTTRAVASRFDVTGFVRNLADGRVELVAEGTCDELEKFQLAVAEAMYGRIRDTEVEQTPATGEFSTFEISF